MASQAGTIELIVRELARALLPLEQKLAADGAEAFFIELGMQLPPGLAGEGQLADAIAVGAARAAELASLIDQLTAAIDARDPSQIVSAGADLVGKTRDTLDAVSTIASRLGAATSTIATLTEAQRAAS